jgi:hypothetical protein
MAVTTNTDGHIEGTLEGTDYGDNVLRDMAPELHTYSLTADGRGKLAFRVEAQEPTGGGGGTRWITIHEKQKIQEATVQGSFDPPAQSTGGSSALVRFNFYREFLARAVDYDLRWELAD